MGANAVENAGFLLILMLMFIGFVFIFTVTNEMVTATETAINNTDIVINTTAFPSAQVSQYTEWKTFLISNFLFLVYLLTLLVFYSSFVNVTSVRMYILYALGGVVATIIISSIATVVWNEVSDEDDILDFSDFGSEELWFITNLPVLYVINLLAGLASFIFVRKGGTQTGSLG